MACSLLLPLLVGSALAAVANIRVQETDGSIVDASNAWAWYALADSNDAGEHAAWTNEPLSFALNGAGTYSLYTWGLPCYATQGGYIAEKLLAMARPIDTLTVRNALLQLPMNDDGKVWEAGNTEYHVTQQGAWESSAEAIIMARHFAAYSGDTAALTIASERLVCTSADGGATWTLAGVPQPNMPPNVCTTSPAQLRATYNTTLYVDGPSPPFSAPPYVRAPPIVNSGRIVTEAFTAPAPFNAIAVPLVQRSGNSDVWLSNVTLYAVNTSTVPIASVSISNTSHLDSWVSIPLQTALPAGVYVIALSCANASGALPPGNGYFLAPVWLSNAYPSEGGGASQSTYGNITLWARNEGRLLARPSSPHAHGAVTSELQRVAAAHAAGEPLGVSLAGMLETAMSFQLTLTSLLGNASLSPTGYDIYVIPDVRFRGSMEADTNTGCSYYDLIRIGFASSYINLRVLESMDAYVEMQAAGILSSSCDGSSSQCVNITNMRAIADAVRIAIGTRFFNASTGTYIDWYGCTSSCRGGDSDDVLACGIDGAVNGTLSPLAQTCLNPVSSDFVPTAILAHKLRVPAGGVDVNATRDNYVRLRDASRMSGGYWRTNNYGLEVTSPRVWMPSSAWAITDSAGFAVETLNNTGDWHMYSAVNDTGYGAWGLQGENGGRFFTTAAMVFEADPTPYSLAYADWKRLVVALTAVGVQLQAQNATVPLLPDDRTFLATPVTDPIVRGLCEQIRRGFPNITDLWGQHLCDYYQDLGFQTPENGVALFAFIKGLLGFSAVANGTFTLLGSSAPAAACSNGVHMCVLVPDQWPADAVAVNVTNLRAAGHALNVQCSTASTPGSLCCDATCAV